MYQTMMFGMNLAFVSNNIGLLWVAVELATLTTVLMVGIYRTHAALEAAWKYFILGSVGIALALFRRSWSIWRRARSWAKARTAWSGRCWSNAPRAPTRPFSMLPSYSCFSATAQGRPRAAARLAAGRARRRSDADLGRVIGPLAERRALCAAAVKILLAANPPRSPPVR